MPVEVATYINQLDALSPAGTDPKSQGDDHLRTIKSAVKQTFPNVAGAVNTSHVELNHLVGVTSAVQPQIDLKASKTGDSYTGIHDFSLATSVKLPAATAIGAVTSAELGYLSGVTSAIQSQFNGVSTALTGKVSRSGDTYTGSHVMTGAVVTVVSQPVGDKSTKAASTKHVDDAITAAALSVSLPGQAGNAGKYLSTDGANAGWSAPPVVSVNGRAGAVAGLVEKTISLPNNSDLNGVLESGFYRLTSTHLHAPSINYPYSQMRVERGDDTVVQEITSYDGLDRAWRGGQNLNGVPIWSDWQRVLGDHSLIERGKYVNAPGSTYVVDPKEASVQVIDVNAPLTLAIVNPRKLGDRLTLMLSFVSVQSIVFSSNVKPPSGGIRAGVSGNILTIALVARQDNFWLAYEGGLHPW